jgi:hypothetical protein
MAPVSAVKVLLATCPRALLRSTLTAPTSATDAPLRIAGIDLLAAEAFGQINRPKMKK